MHSDLFSALRARRQEIHAHWAELLRVEPVNTPLAYPGALEHLIDWTMEEIFREIVATPNRRRHFSNERPDCPCGRNPLLAYFSAAEQIMREALIFAQASLPHLDPVERDASMAELNLVLRGVARREIETFCGVCQYRLHLPEPDACHHAPPSPSHAVGAAS